VRLAQTSRPLLELSGKSSICRSRCSNESRKSSKPAESPSTTAKFSATIEVLLLQKWSDSSRVYNRPHRNRCRASATFKPLLDFGLITRPRKLTIQVPASVQAGHRTDKTRNASLANRFAALRCFVPGIFRATLVEFLIQQRREEDRTAKNSRSCGEAFAAEQ